MTASASSSVNALGLNESPSKKEGKSAPLSHSSFSYATRLNESSSNMEGHPSTSRHR